MNSYQVFLYALLCMCIDVSQAFLFDSDSNFGLDVLQLAKKYGYPSQKHHIITDDGYILQMERIPYGQKDPTTLNRPPVLLVPGLLTGSVTFANLGPEKSLAFVLADSGYDVWLLNYRGTTYSRRHITLNPDVDKKKFWDFSFVEIGAYDIPAAIDRVLLETKYDSLFYIGHSLGCAELFALLVEKPEYNKKVKFAIAMGPVLQLNNTKNNVFTLIGKFDKELEFTADLHQSYEVLPHSYVIAQLGKIFCNDYSPFQIICSSALLLVTGYSPDQLDKSQLPVIISTTPAGSSLKSVLHSSQLYKTGRFARYDYGPMENIMRYGQTPPPLYNVSKITTPISIFYGGKDALISIEDVEDDAKLLPSLYSKTLIRPFNHIDFLWGVDAPTLLHPRIVELMNDFLDNK